MKRFIKKLLDVWQICKYRRWTVILIFSIKGTKNFFDSVYFT